MMKDKETFRNIYIPEYGTLKEYQVSDKGRIKSKLSGSWRLRSRCIDKKGYYQIIIATEQKKKKTFKIHRLVAWAFPERVTGKYEEGLVVHHRDGVKTNNSPENLEWCTSEYNTRIGFAMIREQREMGLNPKLKKRKAKSKSEEDKIDSQMAFEGKNGETFKNIYIPEYGILKNYRISDRGRVKSKKRQHWKFLKSYIHKTGYLCLNLSYGGRGKLHRINRLVAWTFPERVKGEWKEGLVSHHRDHDKLNNAPENLEWCTTRENVIAGFEAKSEDRYNHIDYKTKEEAYKAFDLFYERDDLKHKDMIKSYGSIWEAHLSQRTRPELLNGYLNWKCITMEEFKWRSSKDNRDYEIIKAHYEGENPSFQETAEKFGVSSSWVHLLVSGKCKARLMEKWNNETREAA